MSEVVFVELHWRFADGGSPAGYTIATLESAKEMVEKFNASSDGFVHWWQPRKTAPNKASTPTAGMRRQNKRSKSKTSSVKQAGSPSGG